jgi:hypothetical protein
MMTSIPVLANIVTQFTQNFECVFETLYLPTYFKDVLLLDLKNVISKVNDI